MVLAQVWSLRFLLLKSKRLKHSCAFPFRRMLSEKISFCGFFLHCNFTIKKKIETFSPFLFFRPSLATHWCVSVTVISPLESKMPLCQVVTTISCFGFLPLWNSQIVFSYSPQDTTSSLGQLYPRGELLWSLLLASSRSSRSCPPGASRPLHFRLFQARSA